MVRALSLALFVAAYCLLALSPDASAADERDDAARARQFWKTLAAGDIAAAKAFYSPKVVLKAGSELLKKQWGISKEGDRSKDLLVSREDLLRGYRRMIQQIGNDKWTQVFGGIGEDGIHVSTADKNDQPIAGAKRGDTVLKVATGPGDDALHFILRKGADGMPLVHLEATDY